MKRCFEGASPSGCGGCRPRGGTGGTPWRAWGPPRGWQGCLVAWPDGIRGLILLSEAWWAAPCGGGEPPTKVGGLREDILFKPKEYPLALPKKDCQGGDGVVTSSISLAAAQRAPAHSFRCSSFSHRKTLRWEPCISPPTTPLKRPKERPAGLSFGNLSGGGRGTGDGGRGTPYLGHGLRRPNFVPKFGASVRVVVPYGGVRKASSTTPASRRIAERLRRRGRGRGGNRRGGHPQRG